MSIGIIQANNDSNTTHSTVGGLYRLDTGAKVTSYTTFKMKSGVTTQVHRTYLYYSTDPAADIRWWNPGFYEINAGAPTLNQLVPKAGMSSGGTQVTQTVFNNSGTWNKPSGCNHVEVFVTGGGGGIGKGYRSVSNQNSQPMMTHQGGTGGSGTKLINVANVNSVNVTVGNGGAANNGNSLSNSYGGTGGTSSFGNYISATGGGGARRVYYTNGSNTGNGYNLAVGNNGNCSGADNAATHAPQSAWHANLPMKGTNNTADNGKLYGGGGRQRMTNGNWSNNGRAGGKGVVVVRAFH